MDQVCIGFTGSFIYPWIFTDGLVPWIRNSAQPRFAVDPGLCHVLCSAREVRSCESGTSLRRWLMTDYICSHRNPHVPQRDLCRFVPELVTPRRPKIQPQVLTDHAWVRLDHAVYRSRCSREESSSSDGQLVERYVHTSWHS